MGPPCLAYLESPVNVPWDITVSTISSDILNSYFDVTNVMKHNLSFVFN